MKNTILHAPATLSMLLLLAFVPAAFPQGSLTPPGPPVPTMKRLDQIEARTIVNAANTPGDATNSFIISAPGSYYLTGNILSEPGKNGIRIAASDVTLDLNGFTLIGAADAVDGIFVGDALRNLAVRNGTVRGWRFSGITAGSSSNCLFEQIRVSNNGSGGAQFGSGISAGPSCIVKDCAAKENSSNGIMIGVGGTITSCVAEGNTLSGFVGAARSHFGNCNAAGNSLRGFDCANFVTVVDCTASFNPYDGIRVSHGSTVIRCTSSNNVLGFFALTPGISAGDGSTVADCTSALNDIGIYVGVGSTVRGCTVRANKTNGIYVGGGDCHLTGNTCSANRTGIIAYEDRNRVEGNSCINNSDNGILLYSEKSLVIRNNVSGSPTPYAITGNANGPIVDLSAGGTITTTNPWANFVH